MASTGAAAVSSSERKTKTMASSRTIFEALETVCGLFFVGGLG
jgi:cyanophycinase-like exopeptidase